VPPIRRPTSVDRTSCPRRARRCPHGAHDVLAAGAPSCESSTTSGPREPSDVTSACAASRGHTSSESLPSQIEPVADEREHAPRARPHVEDARGGEERSVVRDRGVGACERRVRSPRQVAQKATPWESRGETHGPDADPDLAPNMNSASSVGRPARERAPASRAASGCPRRGVLSRTSPGAPIRLGRAAARARLPFKSAWPGSRAVERGVRRDGLRRTAASRSGNDAWRSRSHAADISACAGATTASLRPDASPSGPMVLERHRARNTGAAASRARRHEVPGARTGAAFPGAASRRRARACSPAAPPASADERRVKSSPTITLSGSSSTNSVS